MLAVCLDVLDNKRIQESERQKKKRRQDGFVFVVNSRFRQVVKGRITPDADVDAYTRVPREKQRNFY